MKFKGNISLAHRNYSMSHHFIFYLHWNYRFTAFVHHLTVFTPYITDPHLVVLPDLDAHSFTGLADFSPKSHTATCVNQAVMHFGAQIPDNFRKDRSPFFTAWSSSKAKVEILGISRWLCAMAQPGPGGGGGGVKGVKFHHLSIWSRACPFLI